MHLPRWRNPAPPPSPLALDEHHQHALAPTRIDQPGAWESGYQAGWDAGAAAERRAMRRIDE